MVEPRDLTLETAATFGAAPFRGGFFSKSHSPRRRRFTGSQTIHIYSKCITFDLYIRISIINLK